MPSGPWQARPERRRQASVLIRATPHALKAKACEGYCWRTGSSCRLRRSAMSVQLGHLAPMPLLPGKPMAFALALSF